MVRGSLGKLASRALSVAGRWQHQQLHRLNIHEYQGAELMGKYGINVPRGAAAGSVQEVKDALKNMFPSEKEIVVKSQILAGGRGLGTFKSGLQGGVHIVKAEEAESIASKMLGQILVTKQTGPEGKIVSKVLGYKPTSHLSGAQVLPRRFSSLASNGSQVQKSRIQSDAQKSSEEARPKVVLFSPLEAAIAKPRSSPLTSESSKVRRSEIATHITFYMIPALLLVSKNSLSTSLLVGAVFHQVYMFHKEILLDYVHHDITRKWALIYFKLLLLVMAKDTIMYFNMF